MNTTSLNYSHQFESYKSLTVVGGQGQAASLLGASKGASDGSEQSQKLNVPVDSFNRSVGRGAANVETVMAILEEKVNQRIEISFEAEGSEKNTPDFRSPEATAERIVGFATKFFDGFAGKNGGASEELLNEFLTGIEAAIGQGIEEARTILGDASALSDDAEDTISETQKFISQFLEDFRASKLEELNAEPKASETEIS